MAFEIERRFLVKGDHWKKLVRKKQILRQGYLTSSIEGWTIRVRTQDQEKSWLTLKKPSIGIARYEFEYEIPIKDGESILEITHNKVLKTRYELDIPGKGLWIIDCFEGNNFPLVMAEVELRSEKEAIEKPNWCVLEVTKVNKFSNAALAQNPISSWSLQNQIEFGLEARNRH